MDILIIPLHLPGDDPGLRQQAQGPSGLHGLACGFPAAGLWPLCGDTATHNPAQAPPIATLPSW